MSRTGAVKLTDLEPHFIGAGGEGITRADGSPAPERHGVGLMCNCPCGCDRQLYVPFANPLDGGSPIDARQGWQRTGDTFETLTLTPSILRKGPETCGWHGFVTDGEIRTV